MVDSNAYQFLVGEFEGKGLLTRTLCVWENNIKVNIEEIIWEDLEWTDLVQERDKWLTVLKTVMILPIPQSIGYFFIA